MTEPSNANQSTRRQVLRKSAAVTSVLLAGVGAAGAAENNAEYRGTSNCDPHALDECPGSVQEPSHVGTVESVTLNEEDGTVETGHQHVTSGGYVPTNLTEERGDVEIEQQPLTSGGHVR